MTENDRGRRMFSKRLICGLSMAAAVTASSFLTVGTAYAFKVKDGYWDKRKHESRLVLTIFHNNDGESELLPLPVFDDDSNELGSEGGIAHFASALRQARKKTWLSGIFDHRRGRKHASLFVSSGDNFLASPSFAASLENGLFYDARGLDLLRYDAIAIGNHEFDFGPDLLADFIADGFRKPGRPPYLSANLDFSGEPALQNLVETGVIAKSTVVKRSGHRIGIIGATTPNLASISSPRNVVVMQEVADIVQAEVDKLQARGVNKIILISHLQDVNADLALIPLISGVDVAVAGGGDELLANCSTTIDCEDLLVPSDLEDRNDDGVPDALFGAYPLIGTDADGHQVPVVTTSGQYLYLGRLKVEFDSNGRVVAFDGGRGPLRVVSKEFSDGVKPLRRFEREIEQPVAEFVAELDATIIAQSEVDLDGRRSPGVRSTETNEGNLIADALLWQAQELAADFLVPEAQVALQNGGGIRNDSIIAAGDISELDTFDMLPFPNFVTVFPALDRSTFKQVLENAVSRTQPDDIPGGTGRFAQIAGFSFEWSASGTAQVIDTDGNITTAGTRVQRVVLQDGTPIVENGAVIPGPAITVATIDFLARGGDQYPFGDAAFTVLGVSYQQALSNYIQTALGGLISADDYPEEGEGRNLPLP